VNQAAHATTGWNGFVGTPALQQLIFGAEPSSKHGRYGLGWLRNDNNVIMMKKPPLRIATQLCEI